ncbi:MAG: hypothetical protein MHM6MM_002247 [Cercozoa sp. M6MM]
MPQWTPLGHQQFPRKALLLSLLVGASLVVSYLRQVWVSQRALFMTHVFCMLSAPLLCVYPAVLLQRASRTNTKWHKYGMVCAVLLSTVGFIAQLLHKNSIGKQHFTTLHSVSGLCLLLLLWLLTSASWVLYHRQGSVFYRYKSLHRYLGLAGLAMFLVTQALGLTSLEVFKSSKLSVMLFLIASVGLACFASFRPMQTPGRGQQRRSVLRRTMNRATDIEVVADRP